MVAFIPLMFILATAADLSCPTYECASPRFNDGTCISYWNSTYSLSPCTNGQKPYCPITSETNSTCVSLPPSVYKSAYPGESCMSDSACKYGSCIGEICVGIDAREKCQVSGECNPGFYCYNDKCHTQWEINQAKHDNLKGCKTDWDCVNNGICVNSMCYAYFSLTEGDKVDCPDGFNMLCDSGMCHDGLCIKSLLSDNTPPYKCTNDNACSASYYNEAPHAFLVHSECKCGYNPSGHAFCSLLPGDNMYKEYMQLLKLWTESEEIHKCNTLRRFEMSCIEKYMQPSMLVDFKYYYYSVQLYPELQENDECAKKILTYSFYDSETARKKSAGLLAIVSFLVINLI